MGLLDFAKNIGAKLFDKEEEGGRKIQAHIEANNPGVENLQVEVKDGVAVLSGEPKDAAALEKAILMAGNVKGVEKVEVSNIASAKPADETTYYEIQSGDTLSGISKKLLGDANKYHDIFAANKEVIIDPDRIYPGQKIRIPSA